MFKKIKDKITNKMRASIEKEVEAFEVSIVDKVLSRLEYLALNTNLDLEQICEDIKNGGYKLSEKK